MSIGSVTGTGQLKGPCDSYSRGPFTYFSLLRTADVPSHQGRHNGRVFYEVIHSALPPLLKAVWRPRVFGVGNVPGHGGVILASNHLSFVDSVVIPSVAPRKVVFLAKSDYFNGRGVRGTAQRLWFEGLGMLPVDRDDTQSAIDSLETALEVLGRGEAFGIYREGSRSREGRL